MCVRNDGVCGCVFVCLTFRVQVCLQWHGVRVHLWVFGKDCVRACVCVSAVPLMCMCWFVCMCRMIVCLRLCLCVRVV
jgi:hypothetical protein